MGGELHVLPYYLYIMNVSAMFPRRFMDVVVMSAVIGLNKREGQRLADRRPRNQHNDAVHADTQATGRRHTEFQSAEEFLIQLHSFRVPACGKKRLLLQTLTLINRIGQLRVRGTQFDAPHHEVPAFR